MADVPIAGNLDQVALDALYAQQLADELEIEEQFALAHQQQLQAAQVQATAAPVPPPPVAPEAPQPPGIDKLVEKMLRFG